MTPSLTPAAPHTVGEHQAAKRPANDNACGPANDNARGPANDNAHGPIVILTPIGDGIALARALARVLVRRELILANAIPAPVHCNDQRTTG